MPPFAPDDEPIDRQSFYTDLDENDDDGDYELEPVDEEILRGEQERARADMVRAQTSLDIDDVYERSTADERLDEFLKQARFQFQLKHLLMATAVLAVFLSLWKLFASSVAALMLVVMSALVVTHAYLGWRDRQREAMLAARRARLVEIARRGEQGELVDEDDLDEEEEPPPPPKPPLRLNFSLKQVLVTLTVASVALGLLSAFGALTGTGFGAVAAILGLVAVAGLVAFAVGFEMPPIVAFGWWIILLLYIAVSVAQMMMTQA